MNRKSGFTLMELMIVIAIIGILAAAATPPIMQWLNNRKIITATQTVLSSFQSARGRAVKQNELTILSFDSADSRYRVFLDLNQDHVYNAGDQSLELETLPAGVTIQSAAFPDGSDTNWLGFNGQGFPSDTGTVVLVDTKGHKSTLTVSAAGSIQVSD